jgi:hypothetical protein
VVGLNELLARIMVAESSPWTIHPNVSLIKGVVCGVGVEDIEDPLMQRIRYLDKLIDELARGRTHLAPRRPDPRVPGF